jgi:sugar diacid utilization regulator
LPISPTVERGWLVATRSTTSAEDHLDTASNAAKAAASLNIHANTMSQRLSRIDRLLGTAA